MGLNLRREANLHVDVFFGGEPLGDEYPGGECPVFMQICTAGLTRDPAAADHVTPF